jgi:hypothetical protein
MSQIGTELSQDWNDQGDSVGSPASLQLDGVMPATRQHGDLFVPAHADYFCVHCGFPFRRGERNWPYCHEYDLSPDHGRCERRLQDAQDPEGLRMRLRKTQEANPAATRTSPDAIAHEWVRQHYPDVDLQGWEPHEGFELAAHRQLAWTREEVILAMDFYFRVGAFAGRPVPGHDSAEIVQLSEVLKRLSAYPRELQGEKYRNPNGIYLKLMNFRAIQAEGEHGMNAYSQLDAAVWREYVDDPGRLHTEAEAIRARLLDGAIQPAKAERVMEDVDIEQQHTETFMIRSSGEPRSAERAEQKLVLRYRDYMAAKDVVVRRKRYLPAGEVRPIYSDAWVEERHALIEAKNSDSRDAIRQAIGQLYDYRRFHEPPVHLAVLLPYPPNADRLELLRSAGIEAVWPHGPGFRDSARGAFI